MARQPPKRKCLHCQAFFVPDPRCVKRQRYCSESVCRKASKAASQRRWLDKPDNRDYFKGADHVERVRAWRQAHPGYWRRQRSEASSALQDESTPQPSPYQLVNPSFSQDALQDN